MKSFIKLHNQAMGIHPKNLDKSIVGRLPIRFDRILIMLIKNQSCQKWLY